MSRSVGRIEAEPWAFARATIAGGVLTVQRNVGFGAIARSAVGTFELMWESGFSCGADECEPVISVQDSTGVQLVGQIHSVTNVSVKADVFQAGALADPEGFTVSVRRLTPKP